MTDPFSMEQKDNWVSFTFNSAAGYDRMGATVHGEPQFVADLFAVKDFDGKVSTLMKRAVEVDAFFKKTYAAGDAPKA